MDQNLNITLSSAEMSAEMGRTDIASGINAFFAVDNASPAPTPDSGEFISGDLVKWGRDNLFPQMLLGLYDRCSTFQSVVEGTADYISGNGLDNINPLISEFSKRVNDDGDDLFDIFDLAAWNSEMYGGVFIKVTRTADKTAIAGLNILDCRRARCVKDDSGIRYYDTKNGKLSNSFEFIPFWTGLDAAPDVSSHVEVYFWRGRRPRGYYPRPRYASALQAIDTQARIQEYYSSLVRNNFTLCGILTVPADGISIDDQKDFKKRLDETYGGSGHAGRLMVQFVSQQSLKAEYTSISANDLDKQYIEVANQTRQNVYAAFRAIPALFGIMTETTGFSQQEFADAFSLYNITVIAPRQRDLIRVFSDIFGIPDPFTVKPFIFNSVQNAV